MPCAWVVSAAREGRAVDAKAVKKVEGLLPQRSGSYWASHLQHGLLKSVWPNVSPLRLQTADDFSQAMPDTRIRTGTGQVELIIRLCL